MYKNNIYYFKISASHGLNANAVQANLKAQNLNKGTWTLFDPIPNDTGPIPLDVISR